MKLPLTNRLRACAQMVAPGSRVADIGTDHGYLPIWLLHNGIASHVIACDLREQPLASARQNAARFGTEGIEFRLSDGLAKIAPGEVNTVVCAGMGGDLIAMILAAAPWLRDARYTLILQPQSAAPALRRYLTQNGFGIREETLLREGRFYYTVLRVRFGGAQPLSPGQEHLPPQLLACGSPLLPEYAARVEALLRTTVEGLAGAQTQRPEKRAYYEQALREVETIRRSL